MSQRKTGGEAHASDSTRDRPPAGPPAKNAARPPAKNKALLVVSVALLVIWIGFLLTLALVANLAR